MKMFQPMTKSELKALFDRRSTLFASEQALQDLKNTFANSQHGSVEDGIMHRIQELEEEIRLERAAIADVDERALLTLKSMDNCLARIGAMLHYHEGMPWEVAAAVLHCKSSAALRTAVYRGMREAGIVR